MSRDRSKRCFPSRLLRAWLCHNRRGKSETSLTRQRRTNLRWRSQAGVKPGHLWSRLTAEEAIEKQAEHEQGQDNVGISCWASWAISDDRKPYRQLGNGSAMAS